MDINKNSQKNTRLTRLRSTSSGMKVLGLETSCDETAVCLLEVNQQQKIKILKNLVFSQIKIHQAFGGVVPEVAAREHLVKILPLLDKVLGRKTVDLIAVTQGPGLITSLQVGLQTAKTLSYLRKIPLVGINHLEAHLYSSWLTEDLLNQPPKQIFPAVCLIVSGGHTELILLENYGKYRLLGQTRDDAAGEAFDKVAKLLNLGYPGGPLIERYAKLGQSELIELPRPMIRENNFDFSFSGIKTAVRYYLDQRKITPQLINNLCASFQQAVVEVLVKKTLSATQKFSVKSIFIGGGVSANQLLRKSLTEAAAKSKINCHCPKFIYTQDNAAMIALTGYFNRKKARLDNWKNLNANPDLRLVIK